MNTDQWAAWLLALAIPVALAFGIFRLAERWPRRHVAQPADPAVKEEHVDKASVGSLLAGATGAAEALTDCGIETDDAELLANLIESMEAIHAQFAKYVDERRAQYLADGTPESELNDRHTAIMQCMQMSPAFSNPWFLWRVAAAVKVMASREVLEASQLVVFAHGVLDRAVADKQPDVTLAACQQQLDHAVRKLAAHLPKEPF